MDIRGLGYVGLQGPEPKAWLDFATNVCGLMPARKVPGEAWGLPGVDAGTAGTGVAADGSVYLKMDDWQWRIAVHPDERPGLRYLGLEVRGPEELEGAAAELEGAGQAAEWASEAELESRAVHGMLSVSDPAGNRVELFHGVTQDRKFASPAGVSRFVTGSIGMGHVGLVVPDIQQARDFYCELLGFRLSDYVSFGPDQGVWFLHCNERHHTVALCRVGDFAALHHILLEVGEIDDVGCAHDRALAAGLPITTSLGRHANDRMLSFYVKSPLGFDVEIGSGGMLVDERWTPNQFVEGDVWGHVGLTAEAMGAAVPKTDE
ncbi:MAG: glyoxalase [Deltaproteobacteria bacterium]|nr:glyoxalase [Deltaproteobacteria bacterium]